MQKPLGTLDVGTEFVLDGIRHLVVEHRGPRVLVQTVAPLSEGGIFYPQFVEAADLSVEV